MNRPAGPCRVPFIALFLFALALAVFTLGRNVNFMGDDDYIYSSGFAGFARLLRAPGARDFVKYFFFLRHGPLPSLAFGALLRACELLGLPFSVRLVHLPVALYGAATCVLFYVLLAREGFSRRLAAGGALLLIASPIFAMSSRGIATYFAVAIVFGQLLALLAFRNVPRTRGERWLALAALLNLVASDSLFFLSLGALALAYALARTQALKPRAWLRELKPFATRLTLAPALAYLTLLVGATVATKLILRLEEATTMLSALVGDHITEVARGSSLSLASWYAAAAKIAGELFPALFLGVAALAVPAWRAGARSPVFCFSLLASAGFGLLFYVVAGADPWSGALYQIYVLVPILYLFLWALRELSGRLQLGVLALALVSAVAGQLAWVWHLPTELRPVYTLELHGTNAPDNGAEAAGYLVRQALEVSLQPGATGDIKVVEQGSNPRTGFPETAYLVTSGLSWNGEWIRSRLGFIGQVGVERSIIIHAAGCGTVGCFKVETGGDQLGRFELLAGSELRSVVTIRTRQLPPDLPSGAYQIEELNKKFAGRYNHLTDFYPPPSSRARPRGSSPAARSSF